MSVMMIDPVALDPRNITEAARVGGYFDNCLTAKDARSKLEQLIPWRQPVYLRFTHTSAGPRLLVAWTTSELAGLTDRILNACAYYGT